MRNLADAIENFIIRQLLEDSEDTVLVQRNELADKLSCAPSQISYVISTRFTPEKGYLVESRRGSGGFVRIVRVTPPNKEAKRRGNCAGSFGALGAPRHGYGPRICSFKIYA